MKSKLLIPLQLVFMLCTFVSGLDYAFGIGRWKSYVQLFGWLELLLTIIAAVLLVRHLMGRAQTDAAPSLTTVTFLLWLMQFCPAVFAIMISYGWYALFHWVCILLGGVLLLQSRIKLPGRTQLD